MKIFLQKRKWTVGLICALALICVAGTKVSKLTRTTGLQATSRFYVVTQDASGTFYSRYILAPDLATNLGPWITNTPALGTNNSSTNATMFAIFDRNNNGIFRFFGIEQGTNIVIYRNGSNVVINGTGTGAGFANDAITNLDTRRVTINAITTTNAVQSTGGNARHAYAVDLQVSRTGLTNIASGAWSTIGGGSNNMASGDGASVIGGIANEASGVSSLAAGSGSLARDSWAIALGFDNMVKSGSDYGTSIGGTDNILFNSLQASIYGGGGNIISNAAIGSIIGSENSRVWGDYSSVWGGSDNVSSNTFAMAIGDRNRSLGHYGTVIGHRVTNTTPYMTRIGHDIYTLTIDSNALITVPGGILSSNSIGVWGGDISANSGIVYASSGLQSAGNLDISGDAKLDGQIQIGSKRIKILVGDGSPESVVTAAPQSFYFQTNVTTGIGWWIKTNGTSNTGWWRLNIPDFTTSIANTITNGLNLSLSNATMKPVLLRKNNQMLELFGLEAGANISLTPNGTNIVVAAPASSLSDGDKGDITVSGAGAIWTVDNDSISDAKLRESAAYSVIGRASGTVDNPADIVAAADTVLGRSASGNVAFGQITPGQIADGVVMFSKMTNLSTQRLIGRGSPGTGNPESLSLANGLTITGGALTPNNSFLGFSLFQRGTNMWADGGLSVLYSNVFAPNPGGLTNIYITNILDGQSLHIWTLPAPGVTVGFPQFVAADYTDGAVVTPASNAWSHIIIDRRNTTTNIQVLTATFSLAMGSGLIASTNFADRIITISPSAGAGPFIGASAGGIGDSTIFRNALYLGDSLGGGTQIYSYDNIGGGYQLVLQSGTTAYEWGTNVTSHNFRGVIVQPSADDTTDLGGGGTRWRNFFVSRNASASNAVLQQIQLTNQLIYMPANYNGSNGVTATALTNNWDMSLNTFKAITNAVGTNLTFNISNVVAGESLITSFKGIGGYSNTVTFLATSGVNIRWLNWSTNGNYDVQTKPGYHYCVQMFANSATNVNAWCSSDDPWIPLNAVYLNGINVGLSNVISTNLYAINAAISNLTTTNMTVRAGASASNAFVGGVLYVNTTDFTNCCAAPATLTNAQTYTLPAHTLTNNGDAIRFWIAGQTANALATTNDIAVIFGSQTVIDTGLQIASNRQWVATGTITRTGNTSQRVEATFEWPGAGTGAISTNSVITIAQTNGIDTVLKVQLGSQRVAVLTNNYFKIAYEPGPR